MQQKAFTLIELLVVVLIIGILAAVAVPQYQAAVDKAEYASFLPILKAIENSEEMFYLENNRYGNFDEIDYPSFCQQRNATVMACQNAGLTYSATSKMFDLTLPKSSTTLQVYLKHSSKPGRIRCGGSDNTRIERLCKTLGASQAYELNAQNDKYWIIQGQ